MSLLLGGALLSGCGTSDRPTRGEWQREWEEIQDVVPPPAQLEPPVSRETCSDVVATLRRRSPELSPAPDELIHSAAAAWVSHAEHMFFECFDTETPRESIADGYETLERLGAQVDSALTKAERRSP